MAVVNSENEAKNYVTIEVAPETLNFKVSLKPSDLTNGRLFLDSREFPVSVEMNATGEQLRKILTLTSVSVKIQSAERKTINGKIEKILQQYVGKTYKTEAAKAAAGESLLSAVYAEWENFKIAGKYSLVGDLYTAGELGAPTDAPTKRLKNKPDYSALPL